ncbi:hypothetical protein GCM10023328_02030 [Modestobacter marinus]|uniref:Uncharacterized protein n=1 Tax=Modestobacter marinus TaxID=477641 RepID=A0A846LI89_9ACTN|nr:hypothetical protein [Modestobacter marinus]NIH67366.1 hypothetical protein [Modestobacter marinus]GGL54281.1 hypothetical protein GCM10011589_07930 [Modestobacter marinus]
MTTALDQAPPPSSRSGAPAEEELDLATLLQLFEAGEDAGDEPRSVRASLRASGSSFLRWTRGSSRRAASWGAVPGGWQ